MINDTRPSEWLKTMRKIEQKRWLESFGKRVAILIVMFLFCFSACKNNESDQSSLTPTRATLQINDVQVPIFPTAKEQLNYTHSWFARLTEKRVALQAFISLYPQEKRLCGLAALDLAYLELGGDYRFALQHDGFAAIKAFTAILNDYGEFPEIAAKAHWYIGWIYSDVVGEKEKGLEHYQVIAEKFPLEKIVLLPPASWVSIIYQNETVATTSMQKGRSSYWAALALLEIVRNSANADTAWEAMKTLWQNYRDNIATGSALRLMLKRRFHVHQIAQMTGAYMENDFSNVYLLSDLQKELNAIAEGKGGAER